MVLLGEDDEVLAESVEEPSTVDPDLALQTLSLHLSSFSYWGLTLTRPSRFGVQLMARRLSF